MNIKASWNKDDDIDLKDVYKEYLLASVAS